MIDLFKNKESLVGSDNTQSTANDDIEAMKEAFLRLARQLEEESDKNLDYGPWGKDNPDIIKLREAGYDIERLKKIFQQ